LGGLARLSDLGADVPVRKHSLDMGRGGVYYTKRC